MLWNHTIIRRLRGRDRGGILADPFWENPCPVWALARRSNCWDNRARPRVGRISCSAYQTTNLGPTPELPEIRSSRLQRSTGSPPTVFSARTLSAMRRHAVRLGAPSLRGSRSGDSRKPATSIARYQASSRPTPRCSRVPAI